MEINWTLIIIVAVVAVSLIIFLIWRNQKDKEELTKQIIEEEELSIPKEPDKEIDSEN